MHSNTKTDFESLYRRLQQKFPDLQQNQLWNEWDWTNESCEQSVVVSEVAREMIRWAEAEKWEQVEDLMTEIETAFMNGTESVVAFLGTDFTVTLMECENPIIRGKLKQLMGEATFKAYQTNLRGYNET